MTAPASVLGVHCCGHPKVNYQLNANYFLQRSQRCYRRGSYIGGRGIVVCETFYQNMIGQNHSIASHARDAQSMNSLTGRSAGLIIRIPQDT